MNREDRRSLLTRLYQAAVGAAHPAQCLPANLPEPPSGRLVVVGAGKAAAAMAQAVEAAWPRVLKGRLASGFVVVPYGQILPTGHIEVGEAAHPLADAASEAAARRILSLVRGLRKDDLVLMLLSGGGSALMAAPAPGLTLGEKQTLVAELARRGAPIGHLNVVRKHLSAVKGGRLAEAAVPSRLVTLAISDVPGDDPALIASGPTVPDPTTRADAARLIDAYGLSPTAGLRAALAETPKPGDRCFAACDYRLIARPADALAAAAADARRAGVTPHVLGDAIEGEARDVARDMAARALAARRRGERVVLISGGEVTVRQADRDSPNGGPNREFALALAVALDGAPNIAALVADTDGVDGRCEAARPVAGAIVDDTTLTRARALGLDPLLHLDRHRSGDFFAALDDEVRPGATHTNVNDFRAVLVDG